MAGGKGVSACSWRKNFFNFKETYYPLEPLEDRE